MTEEQYKVYHEFFTDYWTYFKKYKSPPDTEKDGETYWTNAQKDIVKLEKKYGESRFVKDILLATWGELIRVSEGKVMEK